MILPPTAKSVTFEGVDWEAEKKKSENRRPRQRVKKKKRKRCSIKIYHIETGKLRRFLKTASNSDDVAEALRGMNIATALFESSAFEDFAANENTYLDLKVNVNQCERVKHVLAHVDTTTRNKLLSQFLAIWFQYATKKKLYVDN